MSGDGRGVQAQFQKRQAIYVHCYAHELNIVLCHTYRAVSEASLLLENLHSFFRVSLVQVLRHSHEARITAK